jgi:peptide subunit release factor 1 (eRF1)
MISKQDLERLLARDGGEAPVLSLYLDMSVNSDNKRTFGVFLAQKESQFAELDSHRRGHPVEALGAAFDRARDWIERDFDQENRAAVVFTEIGGDWFEALQFPVPVQNRMVIGERPYIAPLAQVLESYQHHGVILVDREHVRILSVYLGTLLDEIEVQGKPFPAPHDVQPGGYAAPRYQRRKREEMRHFFREFAKEVEEFVRRYQPDDLVLLGTDENIARFREFLPDRLLERVVYSGPTRVDEPASQVMAGIEAHLDAEHSRETETLVDLLHERVRQDYLATAGFQSTLTALQEGKVDTLVIARDQDREGARCARCGFLFARETDTCPYDGAETVTGIDVVEEAVRMAEAQGAEIEFVNASAVSDFSGVGALLRF